jgi:hypothetical protein
MISALGNPFVGSSTARAANANPRTAFFHEGVHFPIFLKDL